nr:CRISPR-associated protein Cas9 [uncultured bacterium]
MKYTIGLDIGTSSVGWGVIDTERNRIQDLGVRLFESAENQKDGESLAKPRRDARSMRRRLARRGSRLERVKSIFEKAKFLTRGQMGITHARPNDPYRLRAEGLDRLLSNEDLFIAVYHLAKRRGYKSNRKNVLEGDGEDVREGKAVLDGVAQNKKLMAFRGYRTVGEMFFKDSVFTEAKRNKAGSYKHCVLREMLEDELGKILHAQRSLGNTLVTDSFISKLLEKKTGVFVYQRPFASGNQILKLVGPCTFEPEEIRAAKATYSFQYFNVLQRLNNLTIKNTDTGTERKLTSEERAKMIAFIFSHKDVQYAQIRLELKLSDVDRFNMVNYFVQRKELETKTAEELRREIEKKTKFPSLSDYYTIRKTVSEIDSAFWIQIEKQHDVIDAIGEIFTLYKTDEDIIAQLNTRIPSIPRPVVSALLGLSFTKFGHLSLKALRKIIPHLENGDTYDVACAKADPKYTDRAKTRARKLRPLDKEDHSITNPVARRAIAQTIKVVNAIIDKYDSPSEVHIELGRDLAKNFKERMKIQKEQKQNQEGNERAIAKIHELYKLENPRGQDIIKFRLWNEQNGQCMYSGERIDEIRLFDNGYTEIDHIIPFSRSFNDSYSNKVLVLKMRNQEKMNKTPYEYMGGDADTWQRFENLVNSMHNIGPRKKQNLLLKKYVADDLTLRTLNDTRFIARYMKNYIENTLLFTEGPQKQRVYTVNGQATAYLRKRWVLHKDRTENNRHHAQDAVVVAVATPSLVQGIMRHAKMGEIVDYLHSQKFAPNVTDIETGKPFESADIQSAKERIIAKHEHRLRIPEPWEGFSDELDARMGDDVVEKLSLRKSNIHGYKTTSDFSQIHPIFVSRMPKRKTTGRAHQETLRSPRRFKEFQESVVRTPLSSINLKKLEEMSGKNSDKLLYDILRKRLLAHGDDPKKAFTEPVHKPRKDGTQGPLVRSIKMVSEGQRSGILVNNEQALVDQDSMIRIDIFSKPNKKGKDEYYIIPVYAYHFAQKELPNKVITAKAEADWRTIDDTFAFEFSLYPNDLVKLTKGDDIRFGYYSGCNRALAAIHILPHDQNMPLVNNGIKTLDKIDKYVVDILGEYHKVGKETRQQIQ